MKNDGFFVAEQVAAKSASHLRRLSRSLVLSVLT